jgi:uncharacterized protein involved in response to NO
MMQVAQAPLPARARPAVAREDASFPWYIGSALAVAVAGGFVLAVLLPLAVAMDWDWGARWRPLVQAHGHLQIGGWLGLFIVGMAFRMAPRFAGQPLRFARLTPPTLALLLAGLLGRTVAQPWVDLPGMRILLTASVLAELAGALVFATILITTLRPVMRTVAPAPLFMLGAAGLAVQALLGVLWIPGVDAGAPAIPMNRNEVLLAVQFYVFVLPFVLGVMSRALPTFFKHASPTPARTTMIALALIAGTACLAASELDAAGTRVTAAGLLLLAGALAAGVAMTGAWRKAERLRPSARHVALLLRSALVWLALSAALLAVTGIEALWTGDRPAPYRADAVRHMLALGGFSMLVTGMSQLVLPWLAMRRQRGRTAVIETWTLWGLFNAAVLLRVAGPLMESRGAGSERFWPEAAAGVLGIIAVGFFASTILRAARPHAPEIPVHVRNA